MQPEKWEPRQKVDELVRVCANLKSKDLENKLKKPLMEKRRRKRINDSLSWLKDNLITVTPQQRAKLEKADILEMTIEYIKVLQSGQPSLPGSAETAFRRGVQEGFAEASKATFHFLNVALPPSSLNTQQMHYGLIRHLSASCASLKSSYPCWEKTAPLPTSSGTSIASPVSFSNQTSSSVPLSNSNPSSAYFSNPTPSSAPLSNSASSSAPLSNPTPSSSPSSPPSSEVLFRKEVISPSSPSSEFLPTPTKVTVTPPCKPIWRPHV